MNHHKPETKTAAIKRHFQPEQVLSLGFLLAIVVGTLLLALPLCGADGRSVGAMGALFTATSAVCVTGMSILDIGLQFSAFGHAVIFVLIQLGGLGFMIFATLGMMALGRRISLRSRVLIRDSMNQSTLAGLIGLTQWTIMLVVLLETAGAGLLMIRFIPLYGVGKGIWYSFFHSASAFCNAGFDLLGSFTAMLPFGKDPLVLLTLAGLTICGSMGFVVIVELINKPFQRSKLTLHSKLVLISTAVLLAGGAVCFGILEWNNPATLGGMDTGSKLLHAFFQSVTCRSSGFSAMNQLALTDSSKLLSSVLMFIGASPASTGAGVKTTTFALVLLMMYTVIKGREDYVLFHKRIARDVVSRAVTIVLIMVTVLILCTVLVSAIESSRGFDFIDIFYEVSSAVTTTGLSSIGADKLSLPSQLLLLPLMYLGRVGPLTLGFALSKRHSDAVKNRIHYPEESILIG